MNIITFYADYRLTGKPADNQAGFDWRAAIEALRTSAARFGYTTLVVTDDATHMPGAWLRVGNAQSQGLMQWLLCAQQAAMAESSGPAVLVSPDTLISKPLDFMFGDWDLCLLTRKKPKPIINSVIAFRPGQAVASLWARTVTAAKNLPDDSLAWGADIDAPVQVLGIGPAESGERKVDRVRVRLMPLTGLFESVPRHTPPARLKAALWDFKGARKSLMPAYARLLCS